MRYTGQDMQWLIGSLSHIFQIPFDPQLVRQQFPPPYSRIALLDALHALEFKVGDFHLDDQILAGLEQLPFPAVAFLKEQPDGAKTSAQSNSEQAIQAVGRLTPRAANTGQEEQTEPLQLTTPILLIKADAGRVLYFSPVMGINALLLR